jgi:hypothetical protein
MTVVMPNVLALMVLLVAQGQPPIDGGRVIATSQELATKVTVFESPDELRFQVTAPLAIVPSIGIDTQRNGMIDRGADFQLGFDADKNNEPCLEVMLTEDRFSDCQNPGRKAKIVQARRGDLLETSFILTKKEVSADGLGVGFALSIFNTSGNYEVPLASGDYQFGGKISLVKEGPNFMGRTPSNLPPVVELPLRKYQSCLFVGMKALSPLSPNKVSMIKAVPTACASTRAASYNEAVDGLVSSGVARSEAETGIKGLFDATDYDLIARIVNQLSAPARPRRR